MTVEVTVLMCKNEEQKGVAVASALTWLTTALIRGQYDGCAGVASGLATAKPANRRATNMMYESAYDTIQAVKLMNGV